MLARLIFTQPFRARLVPVLGRGLTTTSSPLTDSGVLRLEEPLQEEELFEDTLVRSIRNGEDVHEDRRMPFNVEALAKAAVEARGARYCRSFSKIAEGQCNRVFVLRLDDDQEVVARVSFGSILAPYLSTASEVATLAFLRQKLKVPVPEVYAWSTHAKPNDVGAEYLIAERVPGVELRKRFKDLRADARHLIDQIAKIRTGLSKTPFSMYGALYFKEDVDEDLRKNRLYAEGVDDDEFSDRFRIGPSLHRVFWADERSGMKLDRGPWKDVPSFARAIAEAEKAWIRSYASAPLPSAHEWRSGDQSTPLAHIRALNKYLQIVPYLEPPDKDACTPCLLHPDFHAGNIFVAENGELDIMGIIDWQSAGIGPLYQQMKMPDFLDVKPLGCGPHDHAPLLADSYRSKIANAGPPLSTALKYNSTIWTAVLSCAIELWPTNLALLRYVILTVSLHWDKLFLHTGVPCPISFTAEEREQIAKQWEERLEAEEVEDRAVQGVGVELEGWVRSETWEGVLKRNQQVLEEECEGLGCDAVKQLKRLWPFREESHAT